MARILVTEKLAAPGLELMANAGHQLDVQLLLVPPGLVKAVAGAAALVDPFRDLGDRRGPRGRSRPRRRGGGVPAWGSTTSTSRQPRGGVSWSSMPQNRTSCLRPSTPSPSCRSGPQHPQAHRRLWRGGGALKWEGVELHGKTLGIIGLGAHGSDLLPSARPAAFGMRLLAYDPYVTPERARQMGRSSWSWRGLGESDFVSIHLPNTPETSGLVGKELL